MVKYQTKAMKFISIVMGFLLGGMMWRCRGEGGFGSSWGLYSVGLIILLVVYTFYGNKPNMKYEAIPFGAFLLGLGVTGYATLMTQPAGILESDLPYLNGEPAFIPINYKSGLLMFIIMAFTFAPMFAFFVGSLFSNRKYGLKEYVIIILVFFAVGYIFKATISHPIYKLICPEQYLYTQKGLEASGLGDLTPYTAYMKHFAQRSWSDDIPFFENYYMSIESISDALAILVCSLVTATAFKDKMTAIAGIVINAIVSVGSTVTEAFYTWFICDIYKTTGYGSKLGIFEKFITRTDWGTWEFATGAFFGLAVMLFIAFLPKKYTAQTVCDTTPLTKNKIMNFAANVVLTIFIFALTPSRAIGLRIGKLMEKAGMIESYHSIGDPLMIVFTVILGIGFILMFRKNLFVRGIHITGTDPVSFAKVALPAYASLCFILYLFTDNAPFIALAAKSVDAASFFTGLFSAEYFNLALVMIAFIVSALLYIPVRKKMKKQ